MKTETLKRIEKEAADKYSQWRYPQMSVEGYIAGAKSERNKAIDEAIEILRSGFGTLVDYNMQPVKSEIIEELNKLRV